MRQARAARLISRQRHWSSPWYTDADRICGANEHAAEVLRELLGMTPEAVAACASSASSAGH
jgi:hypothetical protein